MDIKCLEPLLTWKCYGGEGECENRHDVWEWDNPLEFIEIYVVVFLKPRFCHKLGFLKGDCSSHGFIPSIILAYCLDGY